MATKKESTMFCKPCNSTTHEEANCWGPCSTCGRQNHKSAFCKYKDNNQVNTQAERADKATTKNKKKKTGKKATVNNGDFKKEEEAESEEEVSEEDSPRKQDSQEERQHNARSARIRYGAPSYRDLNVELNNMKEDEKKEDGKGFKESYKAYRARVAMEDDTPVTKSMVYSRMQGGRGTETDSLIDTGCTYPLTTTAVTEALG